MDGTTLKPAGVQVFNLEIEAEALRQEGGFEQNGRGGFTLVKTPTLRVLVQVLRAGVEIGEHRAPGPITVQVITGELRFCAGGEAISLKEGQLLTLGAGQPHSVEAVRDTTFLLTLAPSGS